MQAARDDECDTLAEKEELVTLASMGQNSETSNHGPEQVLLPPALGIQLDYIQAKHHQNLFLPTHVFDDIFHAQNHSKPSPRCTLLSTHLHGSSARSCLLKTSMTITCGRGADKEGENLGTNGVFKS